MDKNKLFKIGKPASYIINVAAILLVWLIMQSLISGGLINSYYQGILLVIGINIILATSLNLAVGFLGEMALGHAGFMSVGAYSAALLAKNAAALGFGGLPKTSLFFISLIFGGLVASIFGILVGIPALRLHGDYLAIITLGFGEIIRVIIENMKITGGARGLNRIPKLATPNTVYIVTVVTVIILYMIIRSRHGRAIMSVRDDEIAAESLGIPSTYFKVLAFAISAFFAGVAGGIYAQYIGILGAKVFDYNKSIEILVTVVLGGMGSFTGSILAAIFLTILPEALREFASYRMVLYSAALVIIMIFKPTGLLGTYEFSLTRLIEKIVNSVKHNKDNGTQSKKETDRK
ncbi:MAG: branched-chain amino acid ABC transporter permease [Bacillota bacterium]|nr:branched-chain amino acid ABC transporter permease [Bacillota bacterium]